MRKRSLLLAGVLWLAAVSPGLADVLDASALVGQGAPDFSLPSQEGRLVTYEGDYYGKHNLILTFFPAAFTPV